MATRELLTPAIAQGQPARGPHRGAARRERGGDGREAVAGAAQRPGHQHVERARGGEGRRVAGGDLLRQHRRADGAVDAGAAQGAGRRPAGDRRALAVARTRPATTCCSTAAPTSAPTPTTCVKYAVMGASYARNALGLTRPRVGLLNVGTEEHKGRSRAARGGRAHRGGRAGERLRVHRLRRGQRHAVRPRRRDRHRRLHRQRRAEDRRGHGADDPAACCARPSPTAPLSRIGALVRADLAEAAAEAHRPAPGRTAASSSG